MGIIGFAAGVTLFVDSLFPGPLRIADGWLAVAFLVLMVTWGAMILAVRRHRQHAIGAGHHRFGNARRGGCGRLVGSTRRAK